MNPVLVPDHIFDAVNDSAPEVVEKWLASVAAPRDVVNFVRTGVDHGNATLLSYASCVTPFAAKEFELMRLLISHGADVNHIETDNASPIQNVLYLFNARCSAKAVMDIIVLLLNAGADVNRKGFDGFPIAMAVQKFAEPAEHPPGRALLAEVITTLLRAGASADTSSALHMSGWQAMRDVETMIRQSADVLSAAHDPQLAMLRTDANFATVKAQINGVHAAGSWRTYIMAPRLEVLTLRGLANRRKIRSTDPAMNNLLALPNELICQVLAFWFG